MVVAATGVCIPRLSWGAGVWFPRLRWDGHPGVLAALALTYFRLSFLRALYFWGEASGIGGSHDQRVNLHQPVTAYRRE